jgi:hypothetical protein
MIWNLFAGFGIIVLLVIGVVVGVLILTLLGLGELKK